MQEIIKLLIGAFILLLGFPIGSYLAKLTQDEQRQGQKWFRLIIVLSLAGAVAGLFLRNDILLFSFLFIAIVTSRSLKRKK